MTICKTENSEEIEQQIRANDGYCPCRIIKTEDTKCMCKDFRDQIKRKEPGLCHCGLYWISEYD